MMWSCIGNIFQDKELALQGNENNDNFMQLMMLLGTKDESP